MTPKEQANKIYSDMLYHIEWDFGSDNRHSKGLAKSCSYNAIQLVINELVVTDFANRFDYWQSVLTELNKINT
jgi:hypothetical protein